MPVEPFWTARQETLFFQVRLPRIALALLVGCSLAAVGAAFRAFQNPLVSPDIWAPRRVAVGAAWPSSWDQGLRHLRVRVR
ncbi:MAG: iron chelate uptake ABC transporter family permease subunit [Eggerthella lenta]